MTDYRISEELLERAIRVAEKRLSGLRIQCHEEAEDVESLIADLEAVKAKEVKSRFTDDELRTLAKAASSIRFTADNWEWLTLHAKIESAKIVEGLNAMQFTNAREW